MRSDMPATLPAPLPHPTTGHHDSGACGGQAQPSEKFARMGDEVGRLHGQPRAAKMPQQGYMGRGRLGCRRNVMGGLRGHRGGHRRDRSGQGWLLSHRRWAVAQPLEAKVRGAAKPPPRVAEAAVAMGGWLGVVTCGCAHLASAPKPSSWPYVNSPAASITTSKVATSLPWQASSAAYSSTWSR